MAVNPLMANAAITEPELKSYYVAPIGESGTIQLDNSEHGTITIRPDTPIQGRANGDPVIHLQIGLPPGWCPCCSGRKALFESDYGQDSDFVSFEWLL